MNTISELLATCDWQRDQLYLCRQSAECKNRRIQHIANVHRPSDAESLTFAETIRYDTIEEINNDCL